MSIFFRIRLLIIISCLSTNIIQAQPMQVTGVITSSKTLLPIKNATVTFKASTEKHVNEITNEQGKFTILLSKEAIYNVQVSCLGYITYNKDSITINHQTLSTLSFTIMLQAAEKTLQSVTVTAPQQFITQTAEKIVLNVSASPTAAGGNAYDILLQAPGLLEQNNNLQFRGKTINVLINGRPSYLTGDELKNFLMAMPANGIEKVEILPNLSAKYDALGGSVINIKLAKNKNFGVNGLLTAGIGAGKYTRYNGGLSLNYRNKKINIYGGYDYVRNKQYYINKSERALPGILNIFENEYEIRKRNNHALKLGLDYDINKNNAIGFLITKYSNFRNRNVANISMPKYIGMAQDSFSTVNTNGLAHGANLTGNFFYKTKIDTTGKELTINADYLQYKKKWNDDFTTQFYSGEGAEYATPYLLRDNSPATNTVQSFTIDYVQPGKKNNWEAGLKASASKTDNNVLWQYSAMDSWITDYGKTNHFIYTENIFAAYLNYKRQIKKYNVQLGLRAEHTAANGTSLTINAINKRNYTNIFPNVAVQYTKSQKVQYGFNYRKSIQRFGFDIVNPFVIYQSQYAYYQGNPNIKPMQMHSFELTHTWKYQLFTNLNYTYIKDVISAMYTQNDTTRVIVNSTANLSRANTYSGTLTWVKNYFKGKWNTSTTVAAFYNKYTTANKNVQLQNAKVSAFINFNSTLRLKKGWAAEVAGYYYSAIASGVFIQKPFWSCSAGISKEILKSKGNIKLNVKDIFNTQTIQYTVQYQNINSNYYRKMETRFGNLVFTYKLGNNKVKAVKARKTGIEDEKTRMVN